MRRFRMDLAFLNSAFVHLFILSWSIGLFTSTMCFIFDLFVYILAFYVAFQEKKVHFRNHRLCGKTIVRIILLGVIHCLTKHYLGWIVHVQEWFHLVLAHNVDLMSIILYRKQHEPVTLESDLPVFTYFVKIYSVDWTVWGCCKCLVVIGWICDHVYICRIVESWKVSYFICY